MGYQCLFLFRIFQLLNLNLQFVFELISDNLYFSVKFDIKLRWSRRSFKTEPFCFQLQAESMVKMEDI